MSSPELAANRLEELLAGAFPETESEARLQGLARELRSTTFAAPMSLRERVEAIKPAPRARTVRRQVIFAVATFVLLAASALGAGAYFSGSDQKVLHGEAIVRDASKPSASFQPMRPHTQPSDLEGLPSMAPPAAVEPRGRAQDIDMWIDVRVQDADKISSASQDAVRITRDLGGVVTSSTVDTQGAQGRAQLTLRIPVGNLDEAVFRLTQLGTVTAQRTNTQDLQSPLDRLDRRIAEYRSNIRIELARVASGQLSAADELEARIHLENLRRNLDYAKRSKASIVGKTSMADLTFRLATGAPAAEKEKSGIAGAVDRAGDFLRGAGAVVVFAAIVLSPLLALAFLAWIVLRARSRRIEARLLDEPQPGSSARPS